MRVGIALLAVIGLFLAIDARSQVILDGSVGDARSLAGPRYAIGSELGRQVGGNLYHSFLRFNLLSGETATFSGPGSVSNVIGRVTGGEASSINGTIQSTIPNANLFLINPSGLVFGAGARLDVQGSFHASTADEIRHSDGARVSARRLSGSTFTAASPTAFGFLESGSSSISVARASLQVLSGKTLSLNAGDVKLAGGAGPILSAPSGTVRIVGAGRGTVDVETGAVSERATGTVRIEGGVIVTSGAESGSIEIRGGVVAAQASSLLSDHTGSRDAIGGIVVEAATIDLRESVVETRTFGAGRSGAIRIEASEGLRLSRGAHATTQTAAEGRGGSVTVRVGSLTISGERSGNFTGIGTEALPGSTGSAGEISVVASSLQLTGGGIRSTTAGRGNSGDIVVNAEQLTMAGEGTLAVSGIHNQAGFGSTGRSGSTRITARNIDIQTGGSIVTGTATNADGGTIVVRADRIAIVGDGQLGSITGIVSDALAASGGKGGAIDVDAGEISIRSGGRIGSNAFGSGDGGIVTIRADRLTIANEGSAAVTGITGDSGRDAAGKAGSITVAVRDAVMAGGTISSSAAGTGVGGDVTIAAARSLHLDSGAVVSATSVSRAAAGSVSVSAGTLDLHDGAITTEARIAAGGNISVSGEQRVLIRGGRITTSVSGGTGGGGNIDIAGSGFVVLQGGAIQANAIGGNGGNITITAKNYLSSIGSVVEATSQLGINGVIRIDAPDIASQTQLVVLPDDFRSQAQLRSDACAGRAGRPQSSLVIAGRGALPDSGEEIRAARYRSGDAPSLADTGSRLAEVPSNPKPASLTIACR